MNAMKIVEDLLYPKTLLDFIENYWEQQYLVVKAADKNKFDAILNEEDVNSFLGRKDIYYPFLRLTQNGKVLPKSDYLKLQTDKDFDIVDIDKVFSIYNSGGTIIIQKGQLSINKLSQYCDEFEQNTGFTTNANIYVTQKHSSGFIPHYDTHDLFILQISGKKHWKLYDSNFKLPLPSQVITKDQSDKYLEAPPATEIELSQGDLIYIPRGIVHETSTQDSTSIHITLGIFTFNRIDLLKKILDKATLNVEFRKFLPSVLSKENEKDFFIDNFKSLLKSFIDNISVTDLLSSFEDNFLSQRQANSEDRYSSSNWINQINSETNISIVNNISFRLCRIDSQIGLKFYDKEIRFPDFVEDALKNMIALKKFKVKDISDQIDGNSKVIIVKKLILEGFLKISFNDL